MERHRVLKGYLYAGAGAALFSTKAIFIKLAYMEEANAALMLALRMAMALPFFVAVGESDDVAASFAKQTGATDSGSLDSLINASVELAFRGDA